MSIVSSPPANRTRQQEIALTYLELTRQQMDEARRNRALYVRLGRQYGLTNQAIGDALGITEARVRQITAAS